jgi:tetratricopeptide (TPR) repeat protein
MRLPRDLETICLKCLEKEPGRRYATALELAEDLRRHRSGEPILARPAGRWERLRKWARRRPSAAALIIVSAVAILALAGGGWWSYLALRASAQRAQVNLEVGLDAVESMLIEIGAVDLADVPHMEPVRRKLLGDAQRFLQRFLDTSGNDPAVRHQAGRAALSLGGIEELLGNHAGAEQAYDRGIALLEGLVAESPERGDYQQDLARGIHDRGVLLKKDNRLAEAEAALHRAVELRGHLSARLPEESERLHDLEASRYQLGAVLGRLGQRDRDAEGLYRRALAQQQDLAKQFPDQPIYQLQLARTFNNLGILLKATDRTEAERCFANARDLLANLPPGPGASWQLARSENNLGNLRKGSDPASAERSYRRARELLTRLTTDFVQVPDYRCELAEVELNLAMLLEEDKRIQDAETCYRHALQVLAGLVDQFPGVPDYQHRLATARYNWGILLAESDRPEEAERVYREALAGQRALLARFPNVPDYQSATGCILDNLARLLLARDEPAAAWPIMEQAIQHQQRAVDGNPRNPDYRDFLRTEHQVLAVILVRLDHLDEAVHILQQAIDKKLIADPKQLRLRQLAPLEQRQDFMKLLRDLEAKAKGVAS